ncbi:solute carrier family 23 member 3 isoform X2 [Heterocephalus glaber]|uniref:Solute carrier family 23 member 3 isoform X2 n=1 Tax=Heterocephalus glaber TaxID=10181 RepID=A0AAX6Q0P3_HETGA|nr:solute carrier family 23 member 3 isoform X2 [Heterocephalus glaber]
MSGSPLHPIPLLSMDSQDAVTPLPLLPASQNSSSHSWASRCGPLTWGLNCLLALQHFLVLASLLYAFHLLLVCSLPPGGLSYSPTQLLASSFFACGVSTVLQTWTGSRLPLVQAPSLEFLIPALVLTSQKLPKAIQAPGNASLTMRPCRGPGCHGLEPWNTSLREVSGAVVVSGLLQGILGLLGGPGYVFAHCGPLVLAPSLFVAGLSAHREVAQFCSAHWGLALLLILLMVVCSQHLGSCQVPPCPWRSSSTSSHHIHAPAFRLLSVLIPVASVWILAALLGLSIIPLQVSAAAEAPWFWLPHPGGVLGVTQAVVLSAGFSSFHLADIDSGRNVFIMGFSIFMALLLPRWLREASFPLNTGWSPLDVLLRSLLAQPIFMAGLLGFLLENTISGTRLERGLGQGLPSSFTAQEVQKPQKSMEKAAQEYRLPFSIQNLCSCIPQSLRCLCPMPEDPGDEERGPSEPGETADLLIGSEEPCPAEPCLASTREGLRSP